MSFNTSILKGIFGRMLSVLVLGPTLVWGAPAAPSPAATTTSAPKTGSLQSMSKAVLEQNSITQERLLKEFAEHNREQLPGVLAHLTLGYAAMQDKKYAEAIKQFEAARVRPTLLSDYAEYYRSEERRVGKEGRSR